MQNSISCPKRAQVIIQSLAPSFSSTFFAKKEPKTPKRERRQREFCEKSNKPPPAGSNFVMVRHKRYRAVGCCSPPSKSLQIVCFSNFWEVRVVKITYLAYIQQPDKSTRLSVVSYDEWKQIVQENRMLPPEKRRYFITDCFQDTGTLDCMVIETSYEEYRKWNRERMASRRNRNFGQKICILSCSIFSSFLESTSNSLGV